MFSGVPVLWQYVEIMRTTERAKSTPRNPLLTTSKGLATDITLLRSITRAGALTAYRIGFGLIGKGRRRQLLAYANVRRLQYGNDN